MNRDILIRLVNRPGWRQHFFILNLVLIIVIGGYNFLTRWIPLVHLSWWGALILVVGIDLVCVWGQAVASDHH